MNWVWDRDRIPDVAGGGEIVVAFEAPNAAIV